MIYLDNSATTRPFDSVIDAMDRCMRENYFNASAAYKPAVDVDRAMRECRRAIAAQLGIQESGVIFTGGGTESDNLAILGVAETLRQSANFVCSAIEHPAVAETIHRVEQMGHTVRVLPIDVRGVVDLAACETVIDEHTALVSCMQVSNDQLHAVDVFTAAENIALVMDRHEKYDLKAIRQKAHAICERYAFDIDLDQKVYEMSVSQKQTLEIIKMLYRGAQILILDEPTAVLTPQETEKLFHVMRNMREDGKSIIIKCSNIIRRHPAVLNGFCIALHAALVTATLNAVDVKMRRIFCFISLFQQIAIHALLNSCAPRRDCVLSKANRLMLDVAVRRMLKVGDHVRRHAVNSANFLNLELARF